MTRVFFSCLPTIIMVLLCTNQVQSSQKKIAETTITSKQNISLQMQRNIIKYVGMSSYLRQQCTVLRCKLRLFAARITTFSDNKFSCCKK